MNAKSERLLAAVQELSMTRSLDAVMEVVRHAARDIGGADGATFVLRDQDCCFYAEEDAVAPLWKGKRFPMSSCISGWAMQNRRTAVIPDIYADPRIPVDAYRPTFVKSLVMVPIRVQKPIGAIGSYWSKRYDPPEETVKLLEALANFTSIAIENAELYADLERRVAERTRELFEVNQELEAFSYSVSHDLRAPLRAIDGFSHALKEDCAGLLDQNGKNHLERITRGCRTMALLIDDLLRLARVSRGELRRERVDLGEMASDVARRLGESEPSRKSKFAFADDMVVSADRGLLGVVLENLMGNAWKFTGKKADARIEVGREDRDGETAYFVRDNGVGFDAALAPRLFGAFQRLHSAGEFPGTGIGLATVKRVIVRHGGRVWADGVPGRGATFYFTLPERRGGAETGRA